MFTFLKIIKPFFLPPTLIAIGMLVGTICLWRKKYKFAKVIFIITLAVYYLLSIEPTAYFLNQGLEGSVNTAQEHNQAKMIVVLAGGATENELAGVSWRRLNRGIELYDQLKIPILYSGGSGDPFDRVSNEANLAKKYGVLAGVPENDFWTESFSRDTYESGVAVKEILDKKFPNIINHEIILVTSARHMPRSLGVMKKLGLLAIPRPADFDQEALNLDPLSFFPSDGYFSSSTFSIHEWVGMLGYYLLGWI